MTEAVKQLKDWIDHSANIVFFGGAGVSTESGIPDFRSTDGLYHQQYDYPPETILSHSFYEDQPEEFFRFYRDKMLHLDAQPNAAHQKLAELEAAGRLRAVVTQNIDGLHQKAGSKNVLELHGSVLRNHAAKAILERWPVAGKRVLVLCGKGNNGGDGFVVARHLAEAGGAVTAALLCGRPATPESCAAYGQMPPSVAVTEDLSALPSRIWEAALLVDGVFGTGFSGSIPGELEPVFAAARQAQKTGTPVAALDLPSEMQA